MSQVRILGKGHLLCLTRTLQTSLEEENFADVRLVVYKSNRHESTSSNDEDNHQYLRANKAVLAAASPFFACALKERAEDDEMTLIFDGYEFKDIANMLQYIYTGQANIYRQEEQAFRYLLDQMQIGSFITKPLKNESVNISSSEKTITRKDLSHQSGAVQKKDNIVFSQHNAVHASSKNEKQNPARHSRRLPVYPTTSRPLQLSKAEVTLSDPLNEEQNFMLNPDVMRSSYILEKSGSKFSLLSDANADTAGNLIDYPRMADRLGIYFDPQLFNYYRSLVRSLPPIRIFLHIDEDEINSESEDIEETTVKKSDIVYPPSQKGTLKFRSQRKSFSSSRVPVKTMCCVNGKTHVILDGQPISIDSTIKAIDYPLLERDAQLQPVEYHEEEEGNCEELEAEARRKQVLLSTLSRLKKDHSKAKKVAQSILKASSSNKNLDIDSDDAQIMESSKKIHQRMVICEICGKLISASWIRIHFANHQGEKNYLCEHCGRCFASSNLLKSHVHYQHNNQLDMIKCSICGKAFTKKSRLEIHMRIHTNSRPFNCIAIGCDKSFHTKGNLRKHSFVHSGEKPFKCEVCGKSFAQSTNLRLHLRTHQQLLNQGDRSTTSQRVRKPEAVYNCEFCPMTFSRIRHFNSHVATHTGERTTLPCTICQQEFCDINKLKEHKKSEHPGTVHQCAFCDKSFFKKTAMQRHQASHTGEPSQKPNFPCQHCNSQFTTAAARTIHERSHTGERPFKCPTCSKSFTSKYNFRQHLRMHSEDRPFKCSQCNKAFRQPQHLRAHAYTHKSQDEPCPCPICGKVFRNKILVMSHKRIHKQSKLDQPTSNLETSQQHEETGLQFVDNNMGFVNILVLTESNELQ